MKAQSLLNDLITSHQETVAAFTKNLPLYEEVLSNAGDFTRLEIVQGELDLNLAGTKQDLNRTVTALRQAGFTPTYRPKEGDTSWGTYWYHDTQDARIWFYFSSTQCTRVKVGTKMVEAPIYETECSEDSIEEFIEEKTHANHE